MGLHLVPPVLTVLATDDAPRTAARVAALTAAATAAGWELGSDPVEATAIAPVGAAGLALAGQAPLGARALLVDPIWMADPAGLVAVAERSDRGGTITLLGEEALFAPVMRGLQGEMRGLGRVHLVEAHAGAEDDPLGAAHLPALLAIALALTDRLGWSVDPSLTLHPVGAGVAVDLVHGPRRRSRLRIGRGAAPREVQIAAADGVLRAEMGARVTLERDGDGLALPTVTHDPPELETFGMLDMLRLLRVATAEGRQPAAGLRLGMRAARLWASARTAAAGPSR